MSAPGSGTGAGVDGDAGAVRRRQLVLFSVIAAVVLVVLAVWLTAGGGGQPAVQGGIEAELAGPDIAEKVWTRRSEARIGTIETRLREMETEARRLGSENERLRQKLAGDAANARSVIDRQAAVIDAAGAADERPAAGGLPGRHGLLPPGGNAGRDPGRQSGPGAAGAADRDLRAEGCRERGNRSGRCGTGNWGDCRGRR